MIKLIDLLNLAGVSLRKFKLHCATSKISPPIEAFFDGKFKEWQEFQNQPNFNCDEIISLIHLGQDKWLFVGVWTVHGVRRKKVRGKTRYIYSTKEIHGLEHLVGRAVVQFDKKFRQSYLRGKRFIDELIVSEIRDQRMSIGEFPGYNSVLLSYKLLRTVVREQIPSWKSALSNVAGVYMLSDTRTGQQYIGSAYGGEGIWHRWSVYTKNGHGGNKEIRDLLKERGSKYSANFQFTVLEVCDLNASKDYVISREVHWKRALLTREFGMNMN